MSGTAEAGLYLHYPFCRTKCGYCHFASVPRDASLERAWREGLRRETALRIGQDLDFDTLYIGGGTPSLLEPRDLGEVVALVGLGFRLRAKETTLEANPCRPAAAAARAWRRAGVTRLSIGVQSFDDSVLKELGRGYTAAEARDFVLGSRAAGFANLSLDLMIGVPGESRDSVERSLDETLALEPEHVSVYILENVEGLPFEKVLERTPVDEDLVVSNYELIRDGLESAGLRQYEISNFARPGRECLHNLKYWRYEPFLGLGPSACSHVGGRRWCNKKDLAAWAGALARGEDITEESVELTAEAAAAEALIFGLRLVEGVDLDHIRAETGIDIAAARGREIAELAEDGLLIRQGSRLRIPPAKFLVSNQVFSRFV